MDTLDLLARENEFKKLNKQLENKTESLMKEIEHVMQKQDIFSEFTGNLTFSPSHKQSRKHCCDTPKVSTPEKINTFQIPKKDKKRVTDKNESSDNVESSKSVCNCCILSTNKKDDVFEFLYAFVSVNVKDNILPQSFMKDSITLESVCKFLSAKVKLLQEQVDKLQTTIDNKSKQCTSHMTQLAELESERLSLLNKANSTRCESADIKAKFGVIQNKINEKDRLYKEQRSVIDKQILELKQIKAKNASLEARCASQEELISNLKQQIEIAKISEKEFRDSTRSLSTSHQNAIVRLENKIKSLKIHIGKQTSLIDNLKKQNALLFAEDALKALEKDYNDFLNMDL